MLGRVSRRTKIVCTIGPATATPDRIRELVQAGMDVARLNFSHGTREDHKQVYDMVRHAADAEGRAVGILADLQGPKIRLGRFAAGPVEWRTGEEVRITVDDVAGTHDRVSTTYKGLADDARAEDRLLVDDGKVGLRVTAVEGTGRGLPRHRGRAGQRQQGPLAAGHERVGARAVREGHAPTWSSPSTCGSTSIALSFVRSPADIDLVHKIMDAKSARLPVIAKLEKPEAVDNLEAIVLAFDGVMVARGDLGVELPLEHVPLVQKRAIQIARENAKPVIVATQMLESMITNSRPTRAEASDVANAVLDGADAVMLSGETGVGRYPIKTVRTMAQIVEAVEEGPVNVPALQHVPRTKRGVLSYAARDIGERLSARGDRRVQPVRRHRAPPRAPAHPPAAAGVHPDARGAQPARVVVGRGDVPRRLRHLHRRDGAPGRPRDAVDRAVPARRPRGDRRGRAARHRGLHQPDPRAPLGRGRSRLTGCGV